MTSRTYKPMTYELISQSELRTEEFDTCSNKYDDSTVFSYGQNKLQNWHSNSITVIDNTDYVHSSQAHRFS